MFDKLIPRPIEALVGRLRDVKRRLFSLLFCVPTSLLALLLLFLLAYNGVTVFYVNVPFLAPEPANISRENQTNISSPSSSSSSSSSTVMYVVREQNSPLFLHKPDPKPASSGRTPKRAKKKKKRTRLKLLDQTDHGRFSSRLNEFFGSRNCAKPRFFMTWISPLHSFGEREIFAVESLFKSHPNSCLAIVSRAMDSGRGSEILRPFRDSGFKVIAVSPDYDSLFRNTPAEAWLGRLRHGDIDPGEIALGQNLSNLLRLGLLYKYGGVYADTDVIFLRSFSGLRNTVGAQTMGRGSGNWSRLNNAVLVFDKGHPLLLKFIEEFALTFDGNKWGHNGPYLVSRVVSRLPENPGFGFTVLRPVGFYPVDWSRIHGFFRSPDDDLHKKWRVEKLRQIRTNSYAIHLWNRQSKRLRIESGSIIDRIKREFCVFCNLSNNNNINNNNNNSSSL